MSSLQKLQKKSTQTDFDKKVLRAIPHLHPYVKHRLYIAESTGVIPKNMYSSNDIIDDGIAELYENGYDVEDEALAIKLDLFELVDERLNQLFLNEDFHKQTFSTSSILKDELDRLDKVFVMDADNDYIMAEDLDDISYHQDDHGKHIFLYDTNDSKILETFELEDVSAVKTKSLLGKFYSTAPQWAGDIIDLYVFGKLNFEEIARIKKIDIHGVEKILKTIRQGFDKQWE